MWSVESLTGNQLPEYHSELDYLHVQGRNMIRVDNSELRLYIEDQAFADKALATKK